jgi:hypothetical protein
MKYFFCVILFIGYFDSAFSQDGIAPITANPDLFGKNQSLQQKSNSATFDSTFVYLTDTLSLPFFDEFSKNNFQTYDTDFSGSNVTSQLFHRMLDVVTELPLPANSVFTDSATYRMEVNLILDTIIYHKYDSVRFFFDDLANYPVDYINIFGYPPYIVIDTVANFPTTPDTVWLSNPEYVQDSARIFLVEISEPGKLWLNDQAYHNYRLAVNPWSLGVVSFDGLDEKGYPYLFGSTGTMTCDTLLSKPIDMSFVNISDSVYFSFLYQTEGYGDVPEAGDSLFLEFYSPSTLQWKRVWRAGGEPMGDFKVAHIKVDDPVFFQKGFQFRFMNFGSPAGFLDHFHIDYVNLRQFSGFQDTLFKDFAFVYPISTLLKDYISVPWKHYRNHPAGKMSDEVRVDVRNGSELTENNQNGNVLVLLDGAPQGNHTLNGTLLSGGNINYAPRTSYTSFHNFSTGYAYDETLPNDTLAVYDWIANASAQFPSYPQNDSTFGQQVFKNYYAYDDGTAEKAYGVTGQQGLLAYKFNAYQSDSLIGIDIHFVPSVVNVANNLFLLAVWNDNNGVPGTKVYEDEFFFPRQPKYTSARNKFTTYVFKDTMKVAVDEVFYIGMRQIDEERLNIGFDMNHDNSDKIFWSVDGGNQWNNASFPGSVMMRPLVTSKLDYTLDIPQIKPSMKVDFSIYPNPASSTFSIDFEAADMLTEVHLLDMNGRLLISGDAFSTYDVSGLKTGMYFVRLISSGVEVGTKKLIVQ